MKVGIVGCGWVAKKQIAFLRQIRSAEIVGVADKDKERLKSFLNLMKIDHGYTCVEDLIAEKNPNVIHVLTPPQAHLPVALAAIERGKHVLIEKPIGLNFNEAKAIYDSARANDVKVCVDYNHLYDPCMQEAIRLSKKADCGKVIYLECYYCMNVRRHDLQKTTADNQIHWSYGLPGGLFHNYIDHPLYTVLRFTGKPKNIHVLTRSFGTLPQNIADEMQVLIQGEKANGLLVISFACRPYLHFCKIYCENRSINVNFDTMSTVHHKVSKLPKAASKATFNLGEVFQLTKATFTNTVNLLTGRLKSYQGMKDLIQLFYKSIERDDDPPIPEKLALDVASTIDEIWRQSSGLHLNFTPRPSLQKNINRKERVLVTGASGFIGKHLVKRLVKEGYYVRAFVRKLSYINELEPLGVEIVFGDIRHLPSFRTAVRGMDIIVHLAAATKGDPSEFEEITVGGTKNLITVAKDQNIQKVIYMGSMSVYEIHSVKKGVVLTEEHTLEQRMKDRGAYSFSKGKAEKIVIGLLNEQRPSWTILRPSMILGPGNDAFFTPIGFSIGNKIRLVIGRGDQKLRLIHVDDVVEAICLCMESEKSGGKIYNIVHHDRINKREYLENYIQPIYGKGLTIYIPYFLIYVGTIALESLSKIIGRPPFLTRYRLIASQRDVVFDTTRIRKDLGWKPYLSLEQGLRNVFGISRVEANKSHD